MAGASNLGEWLQLAAWDIKALFGDEDAKSHAEALREVNAQATPVDRLIYTAVESEEIAHTGVLGVLDSVGDTIRTAASNSVKSLSTFFKSLNFLLRNPWVILIVIGIAVVLLWPLVSRYLGIAKED